jgi:hypothetical protein
VTRNFALGVPNPADISAPLLQASNKNCGQRPAMEQKDEWNFSMEL